MMNNINPFKITLFVFTFSLLVPITFSYGEGSATECYESRIDGYTIVMKRESVEELPNIKCSETTGRVMWWGDPFDDTQPLGDMPIEADYSHEEAVVKAREKRLKLFSLCTIACHNGKTVPVPKDKSPRLLNMHQDIVPNSLELKHGKGAIWCLDCHSATNRSKLISHKVEEEISFNQPQKLCGKCHGPVYRVWREGIHGKRIGMWTKGGKKRWWVCTECHNPHDVEPPYKQIPPEPAPVLPKSMKNIKHETGEPGSH
jgi:hypothetical protein